MGAFGVLQQVVVSSSVSSDKLIATYLTQEGIELVRNIRDSNWVNNRAWDTNIEDGGSTYRLDIYEVVIVGESDPSMYYIEPELSGDSSFYERANVGKFSRRITIVKENLDADTNAEKIRVIVAVGWEERGRFHTTTAEETLYDYHQEIE